MLFFSCPIVLFLCYPSKVGALLLLQSLLILAMLHPLQLLCRRLSLVADDVAGCRVDNIVIISQTSKDQFVRVTFPFTQ